jgi:hypothetical protein
VGDNVYTLHTLLLTVVAATPADNDSGGGGGGDGGHMRLTVYKGNPQLGEVAFSYEIP